MKGRFDQQAHFEGHYGTSTRRGASAAAPKTEKRTDGGQTPQNMAANRRLTPVAHFAGVLTTFMAIWWLLK